MDLIKIAEGKIDERLNSNNDNPFYLVNLNDIREKCHYWREKLPRVEPYYAVKCNNNQRVMKTLNQLNVGFECASKGEVEKVLELNIDPQRIIYSHTVKQLSHLTFCAENNVKKMTFDSSAELLRIKENFPNAEVFIRIRIDITDNVDVSCVKFGCDSQLEAPNLIKLCKEQKMNLIGINFHIGSITEKFDIYEKALGKVRKLFDFAATLGFKLNVVNIGGGFMGHEINYLDNYVKPINDGIEKYFPDKSIKIVAEPGRYFVESSCVMATQIILKRISTDGHVHYYLNEGVFLSFLFNLIYGKTTAEHSIIRKTSNLVSEKKFSTVWGCSCHYIDKVIVKQMITECEIGDWLIFHNMGAYTTCASTNFNGFDIGNTLFVDERLI